jgi:hypothetical protein
MQQTKIEIFIKMNGEYFNSTDFNDIRRKLMNLDENQLYVLQGMQFQEVKPFYKRGLLDLVSEKTRNPQKYNFDQLMNQVAIFEEENQTKQRELDLKNQKMGEIAEDLRHAAEQKMRNESYFLEADQEGKAYSKDEVKALLSSGDIKMSTRIKLGADTELYQTILDFDEFNQGFKDFM